MNVSGAPLEIVACDGAGADVDGVVELVELLLGPVRKKLPAITSPNPTSDAKTVILKLFREVEALTKVGATLSKLGDCRNTKMT